MLTQTFIHSPGIGPGTERKLWRNGFVSWEICLENPSRLPLSAATRQALVETLEDSMEALERGDAEYFARALPAREHWRAARNFKRIGYLDIETDGGATVTVVGVYDGNRVRQYVKGDNLEVFPEEIIQFDLLVTFFGSAFDIPMLRRSFPGLPFSMLHLDLCHSLRKLGYRGGLKSIERTCGIQRSPRTTGLSGWDAVRLWREYQEGDEESLATLLAYNAEDIVNLEPLLDLAYDGLYARLMEKER